MLRYGNFLSGLSGKSTMIGRYDPIPEQVHFMVYCLELRMCLKPFQGTPYAFRPGNFRRIVRYKALDFAIIKHYAIRFITQKASEGRRIIGRDQVGRNMDHAGLTAERLIGLEMNLIPTENLIRRDLKRLANGFLISQQANTPLGKIRVPCQHPEGRAIPGDDHLLSAFHAVNDCPGMLPT